MKKLVLFLTISYLLFNIYSIANAAAVGYFAPSGKSSSTVVNKSKYTQSSNLTNYPVHLSAYPVQLIQYPPYYPDYINNINYYNSGEYNNVVALIYSKSLCDKPIEGKLKGISVSIDKKNTKYFLQNGQIWKQYITFSGYLIDQVSSMYNYTSYFGDKTPTFKIYRDQTTNACKILINGQDTGMLVYREN